MTITHFMKRLLKITNPEKDRLIVSFKSKPQDIHRRRFEDASKTKATSIEDFEATSSKIYTEDLKDHY